MRQIGRSYCGTALCRRQRRVQIYSGKDRLKLTDVVRCEGRLAGAS